MYFPLTKRQCLVLRERVRRSGRHVFGEHVRAINKLMIIGSRRFLDAAEKNNAMEAVFNRIGCKSIPGRTAFMREPPPAYQYVK